MADGPPIATATPTPPPASLVRQRRRATSREASVVISCIPTRQGGVPPASSRLRSVKDPSWSPRLLRPHVIRSPAPPAPAPRGPPPGIENQRPTTSNGRPQVAKSNDPRRTSIGDGLPIQPPPMVTPTNTQQGMKRSAPPPPPQQLGANKKHNLNPYMAR